jgi:hypothetical protein
VTVPPLGTGVAGAFVEPSGAVVTVPLVGADVAGARVEPSGAVVTVPLVGTGVAGARVEPSGAVVTVPPLGTGVAGTPVGDAVPLLGAGVFCVANESSAFEFDDGTPPKPDDGEADGCAEGESSAEDGSAEGLLLGADVVPSTFVLSPLVGDWVVPPMAALGDWVVPRTSV